MTAPWAFEALARLEQARAQAHAQAEAAGQAFADVATQAQRLARELGDEMAGLLGEGESQPAKPGQTLTEEVQGDSARINQAMPDLAGLDEAFGRLAARASAFAERAEKLAATAREKAASSPPGRMFMLMSKQAKLPFRAPFTSPAP